MVLIGYGIWHAGWHIWLPPGTEQEKVPIGSRYIFAGCPLSLAAAAWSGARENRAWATVCVGLPGILVGWSKNPVKQSIFARVAQLAKANLNALLDNAEDPQKMLDQMVLDYSESIREAEAAVATTVGNLRMAEDDYNLP